MHLYGNICISYIFDFIECFTTTFLRAHSWLNWVDEDDDEHDEVGLKEKPEDTRYIKKITSTRAGASRLRVPTGGEMS